jgi:hypothetical protein
MGSGKGKSRRAQSVGGVKDDVFHDVEGWCLKHPNPGARQELQTFIGRSKGLEAMKRQLQTQAGGTVSRHEINREISRMVSEESPVDEAWGEVLTHTEDPRLIAAHAIVMARAHIGRLSYLLDECIDRVDSPQMKEAIALSYGCLGDTEHRPRLEEMAQDSDEFVRNAADWALKQMPSEEQAEEILVEDFNDFVAGISATDFARYDHYRGDDEHSDSDYEEP